MLEILARVEPPTIDGTYLVNLLMRVLHITFAAMLVGGLLYRRLVLVGNDLDRSDDESMRRPWAMWVGVASGVLLLSGFYNTWLYLLSGQYEKLSPVYHAAWGLKFLLALALMTLAALLAGRSNFARKLQKQETKWLNVAIAIAILIFTTGAVMRSFSKIPPTATFAEEVGADEVGVGPSE